MSDKWTVQLAKTIEDNPVKSGTWYTATEKLNGIRATYYDGKLIGRRGTAYTGLDHIISDLKIWKNTVFDGEITLADKAGLTDNEAFRRAAGLVRRKTGDKPELVFTVFDKMYKPDFDNNTTRRYSIRRSELDYLAENNSFNAVRVLPALYSGTDTNEIPALLDKITREGGEGIMLNLDAPYQRRRTSDLIKVKRFYTMDLPIVDVLEGEGENKNTLGAFIVDFHGCKVGVGTGFTRYERDYFWHIKDALKGTLCEVKYKEISQNKQGGESLQFPTFVQLRTDKQDVSAPAAAYTDNIFSLDCLFA